LHGTVKKCYKFVIPITGHGHS